MCNESEDDISLSNSTEQFQDDFSTALLIAEYLNLYYIPVIIIVGIIGNSLSATVFLCTQLKSRSSSYYLAALALTDLIFLVNLFCSHMIMFFGIDLYNRNVFCQAMVYTSSVCCFLSVWLIVSFTVERFIAIQYPLHRPHMCTVKRAKTIVIGLAIFSVVNHIYLLFTAGIVNSNCKELCAIKPGYEDGMAIINILDTIMAMGLPVILIIVMNTMIAIQLYRFSKSYNNPLAYDKSSVDESAQYKSMSSISLPRKLNHNSQNNKGSSCKTSHGREVSSRSSQRSIPPNLFSLDNRCSTSSKVLCQRTQNNITKMLLLISTAFVALNLPSYVIRIYMFAVPDQYTQFHNVRILQEYFMLLFYTQFAINFLLYSTCGHTFRRALSLFLQGKLKCSCIKQDPRVTYKCMLARI